MDVLHIGDSCIYQVAETLRENKISGKILYVSDSIVDNLYGGLVRSQISDVGQLQEILVNANTIAYAMSLAETVISEDIDCIVAMGGGRVLDVGKYAAYVSKRNLLSVATTLSNDGIASPIAVLKTASGKPKSLGCVPPTMLLIDTEIVQKAPLSLIKAGIGDTISNYMALLDWELAVSRGKDTMNGYAFLMSQTSLDALLKTQYTLERETVEPEFIRVLANALVISGIAMFFAGSSRPVSGSEHLFSHALDYHAEKTNLHGLQVALGTVAMLKLIGKSPDAVLSYLKRFNVDIHPQRMGIDEETFVHCMCQAPFMRTNRYTYLNEIDLNRKRLCRLYQELLEVL